MSSRLVSRSKQWDGKQVQWLASAPHAQAAKSASRLEVGVGVIGPRPGWPFATVCILCAIGLDSVSSTRAGWPALCQLGGCSEFGQVGADSSEQQRLSHRLLTKDLHALPERGER